MPARPSRVRRLRRRDFAGTAAGNIPTARDVAMDRNIVTDRNIVLDRNSYWAMTK